jgi:hypothetical protein
MKTPLWPGHFVQDPVLKNTRILFTIMKFLALSLISGAAAANLRSPSYYEGEFKKWQIDYGVKFSSPEEEQKRLQVFSDAEDTIATHNMKNATWTVRIALTENFTAEYG